MRLLVVLALVGCGEVTATPDAPPSVVDSPVDSPMPDVRVPVWGPYQLVTVNRPGPVRNPAVSNDGLNIFFMDAGAGMGDVFDAFQASRITTATAFGAGSAITAINVMGQQQRYLEISGDGLEIYYTDGFGPIMMSSRANVNAAFSTPVAAGAGIVGNFASISGDKLSLYYLATVSGFTGALKVATRTVVGQPFSNPVTVPLNGAVEIFSSIDVSRDELTIVRAPLLTGTNPAPPVINRRASKSDSFVDAGVVLPAIDFSNMPFTSARFAQNETELWIGQNNAGTEAAFVSRLQ